MTATVTLDAVAASDRTARITVTVTGADPAETIDVLREDGGRRTAVLGATGLAAESTVLIDAAVPLNRPVSYVAVLDDGSEVASGTVTVTSLLPVLSDPWLGAETLVLVVDVDDELQWRSRVEVLSIEGSTQPVAITDRPVGQFGRLVLYTRTGEESAAVEALASTARPLLLRCSCGLHPDRWIQPTGDKTTARLVRDQAITSRLHQWEECIYLPAAPFPGLRAAADTLQELYDAVPTTLDDIAGAWATLGEIAVTDLSGGI